MSLLQDLNDYKLEATFLNDGCVLHKSYQSNVARGIRKVAVHERWTPQKPALGSGSFGIVRLETKADGGQRAVKELHKPQMQRFNVDYKKELLALTKFSRAKFSLYFVHFLGWFENDDHVFLAMEYLRFGTLDTCIQELEEADAKTIALQLIEGLSIMHEEGFTHRDLKPQNIFIVQRSPWWVKIGDFGITKRISNNDTALHTTTGTPLYVAPEVFHYVMDDDNDSTTYTNAVDIWSFGCVVYQMLAHEVPFKNFPRQLVAFCRGAPFPESLLSKRVTQEAIEFVKSTLIPLPQSRPSAKQVMQAIWLKTEESQKELDTWNRTLEYLQPGFNLSSLTATRLRYILLCNNIPHSPGAEKPALVEIVSRMVLPRASQIRSSSKTANLLESGRVKSAERVAAMQRQLAIAIEAQENGRTVPQFVEKMKAQDVAQKQAMQQQQQQQAAQQQQQRGNSHRNPRPTLPLSKNHARVASNHSDALHKRTWGPAQATITSKATFNYPDSITQWTMKRVLLWLVEKNFSQEWQETFKALNIHGSQLLSLGSDNSVMYTVIYARLEQEYSYSGKKWDQARSWEEGNRLRQLIGFLVRAQNPTTSASRHQLEHLDSDLGRSTSEGTIQSTETAISELEISTHSGSILDDIFHIPTSAAFSDELLPGLKDLGEPRKHDISTARDTMSTAAPTYPPSRTSSSGVPDGLMSTAAPIYPPLRTSSPGVHRDESTTSRPLPAYESPYITNRYENFPASQASSSSFIDRIPNFFNRTKGKMVPLDKHGNRMR